MNSNFIEKSLSPVKSINCLNTDEFWQSHSEYVIQANKVEGNSFFYPLYRWNDMYSFSPLPLMIRKGNFRPNAAAVGRLFVSDTRNSHPDIFIDHDIQRLGTSPVLSKEIKDRNKFIRQIATAMQQDVNLVERKNQGKTNIILCGGRDSLNLLLLNRKNPTIVYSASPNTPLVADFVRNNDLNIEVRELLTEENSDLLSREIAESATMVELENWKWTPHLFRISNDFGHNVVFWKGQFADAFLTDYWRSYTNSQSSVVRSGKKIYKRLARTAPIALSIPIDYFFIKDFAKQIWLRGAVQQGSHMGFLRSITDCLWVSGYHGPNTSAVWTSGNFSYLTRSDLRPEIGESILGRPVIYPGENPSPPPALSRKNLRGLDNFNKALKKFPVSVLDHD